MIAGDVVTNQMRTFLTLELEEHALVSEMFDVAVEPIDLSSNKTGYYGYDWPKFQMLQRRLFVVQLKMKKTFLVMKLKAEFISLIGTRLGEFERQRVSSAMEGIYNSHFTKMANSVEGLQTAMQTQQAIGQANYESDFRREEARWSYGLEVLAFVQTESVNWLGRQPILSQSLSGVIDVMKRFFQYVVIPQNPFYLKSVDSLRTNTLMSNPTSELTAIKELYNLDHDAYAALGFNNSIPEGKLYNSVSTFPHQEKVLDNMAQWVTQNEMRLNDDLGDTTKAYTLTLDEVVNEWWSDYGYDSPKSNTIYSGTTDIASNTKGVASASLEDHVLYRLSTRHYPGDGNKLMFFDSAIYKMSGAKLISDEDFFDWIQGRIAAEMMTQMYFTMVIASYRSLTNKLGFSSTGGNDAMQASTGFTGEIGQHYFTMHNTLTIWEQLLIDANNKRFEKMKELDKLILEGIIAVVALAFSQVGALASSVGSKMGMALRVLASVAMVISEAATQLTDIIYNFVDGLEENQVLEKADRNKKNKRS